MKEAIQLLKNHNLRKTSVRIKTLEVFLQHNEALAQSFIENAFEKVDRITLYRTLKSFEEKGLIHKAIDGSDKVKYALCNNGCTEHNHQDHHAHFHCDDCGRTYCLEDITPPSLQAPEGFTVETTHLVMKGICDACVN